MACSKVNFSFLLKECIEAPGGGRNPTDARRNLCVGHTGSGINIRINEHHYHNCLFKPEILTVAEHDLDFGHHILLNNARILAKKSRCMDWLMLEVIEI
jgi:hypothetical protein